MRGLLGRMPVGAPTLSSLCAALSVCAMLSGCATAPAPLVLRGEGLGSEWTVKLSDPPPRSLAEIQLGIQARIHAVSRHINRWDDTSELAALNTSASSGWQSVSRELLEPLTYAFELAGDTGGAFDPTVAPLVDVWGFGKEGRRFEPPSAEALSAARSSVGFEKVTLNASTGRIRKPAGLQIDLSSMQHGRGADEVAEYLAGLGISSYFVDVGSEIRARGESPEGGAWRVGIERPPTEDAIVAAASPAAPASFSSPAEIAVKGGAGQFAHVVSLRDAGIATSGNFRYFFDYNSRRYSHRIDPRTGEPVSHDLVSVTVIAPICMHADALATALTVLGPDAGFEYAAKRHIAALFISSSSGRLVEKMTPRFAAYLK